jgi:hypothetical protein
MTINKIKHSQCSNPDRHTKHFLLHNNLHMILGLSGVFSNLFNQREDVKLISGEDHALVSKNY